MTLRALGSALLFAAAAAELSENSELCCEECVAPKVKYYSVDADHGHCGECCLDPRMFPVFKLFEKNLTLANGKTCGAEGYSVYDKTEEHGVPPLTVKLDLYNAGSAPPIKLHRVVHGECGQLTVPRSAAATSGVALLGLEEGACADEGYTQSVGVQSAEVPVIGTATVELFREPNFLGLAVDLMQQAGGDAEPKGPGPCCSVCEASTSKFISVARDGGSCLESCMSWMAYTGAKLFEPDLEPAGTKSCATIGFPTYDGTSVRGVPPASVTVDMYGPLPQEGAPGVMRKIVDGLCGQTTVTQDAAAIAERAGLVEGSCAAAGFTQAITGTSAGPLEVKLYRKIGEPSFLAGLAQQFNPLKAASLLMV